MFFKTLVLNIIENILNIFLYRSPALKIARQRLNGNVLCIFLKDLSIPLVLVFSEYRVNVLNEWKDKFDCSIDININILLKLRNFQQLILLIHKGELEIAGDVQVLRDFITFIDLVEFDPIELLVPYIGDIAAESINKAFYNGSLFLHKSKQRQKSYITDIIVEEWRIAIGSLEMAWFLEETTTLDQDVELLTKRIGKLEGK